VTAASPTASPLAVDGEGLIELRRETDSTGLSSPWTTWLIAGSFLVVAVGALFLPAHRTFSITALLVCLVVYVTASRVEFEFGGGWAIPTEVGFVTMWFLLPPRILPIAVCAGLLLSALPDLVRRRMPPERIALAVVSSWHAVGPAIVLFVWASDAPHWQSLGVYLGALAAQFAFDFVSIYSCTRAVVKISPLEYLRTLGGPAWAVDAMLFPLGLLVAFPAFYHPWSLLLVLPVLLMFSTFSKERQHRIDNALELSSAYRGTAMLLGDVIEADDEYTGSHSRHVVDLVLAVSDRIGLDAAERRRAEFAALLHDVGKVKVPSEIINKPGSLDAEEWEIMKTHTILGEKMLEQIGGLLGEVGNIVRSCHERWDGTGYPDGLAGEQIPLAARIVCACDAWSAMRTDRTYRTALSEPAALTELRDCAGTHFDPTVVAALIATIEG
jgi:HD-GYP domain-containing protein (c-di-GMP phosphodiesterase class II)